MSTHVVKEEEPSSANNTDAEVDASEVENLCTIDNRCIDSNVVVTNLFSEFNNVNHKSLLQENFDVLGEKLALDDGLLAILFAIKVVNMRKREEISAKATSTKRNEALVDFLINGPISNFLLFVHALVKSDQRWILLNVLKLTHRQSELIQDMSQWSKADFDALKSTPDKQRTLTRTEPVVINSVSEMPVKCRSDDTPELLPSVVGPAIDQTLPCTPDIAQPKTQVCKRPDPVGNKSREPEETGRSTTSPSRDAPPTMTKTGDRPASSGTESSGTESRGTESKSQFFFYGGTQTDCMIGDGNTMNIVNGQVVKRGRSRTEDGLNDMVSAQSHSDATRTTKKCSLQSEERVETLIPGSSPNKALRENQNNGGLRYDIYALIGVGLMVAAYVFGPNISDIFFHKR